MNRRMMASSGSTDSSGTGLPAGRIVNSPRSVLCFSDWSLIIAAYFLYSSQSCVRVACCRALMLCAVHRCRSPSARQAYCPPAASGAVSGACCASR